MDTGRPRTPAGPGHWQDGRVEDPQHHQRSLGLVATSAVSVQFGAALATRLFGRVGPLGAATLRLGLAALALCALAAVPRARTFPKGSHNRHDVAVAVAFGLVLAAMNLSFYEAIYRIPLGVAVTVEFSGPLLVSIVGSRRWTDGVWGILAGGGVALLASGVGRNLDAGGLALALLAGACWIGYILLSKQTGRRFDARFGLAIAMAAGAFAVLPAGLVAAGTRLFAPRVLLLGALVALLSSAVPYTLELLALRHVSPRAFGVMLSLDPAVAALAGFAVIGQHLSLRELAALGLVVGANAGNSLTARRAVLSTPA